MVSRWVDSEYIFTLLFSLLFSFMSITIETGDGTSICLTVKKHPKSLTGQREAIQPTTIGFFLEAIKIRLRAWKYQS